MSGRYDAIVIGGDIGGLVASAYLARAGRKVLLLEAEDALGGSCRASTSLSGVRAAAGAQTLFALDPCVVKDLKLTRRGLKFAVRDMALVNLRQGGSNLALTRDVHAAARAIAAQSPADAEAYKRFCAEISALARALRPWWWENAATPPRPASVVQRRLLAQVESTSAAALLSERFESDALRAALAFDIPSPFEPGSALALVWRASQEMCGLQSAVAMPMGGMPVLAEALAAMVQEAGVDVRTRARTARLILAGNTVSGVELEGGETVFVSAVLSSLSRRKTLLDLSPPASIGFDRTFTLRRDVPRSADATIHFLLNAAPVFGGSEVSQTSRFVVAPKLEASVANHNAARRDGGLPDELAIEVIVPASADKSIAPVGQHVLSVRVQGVPIARASPLPPTLVERVLAALEPHTVHLRERIIGTHVHAPEEIASSSSERLLSSYAERIETPILGLFLCGTSAEPMDAVSGRAGRIAADIANGFLAREKRA